MKRQMTKLIMSICLLVVGVHNAMAAFSEDYCYKHVDNITIGNLKYELWRKYTTSGYLYSARLIEINGTEENVTVLASFTNGSITYPVEAIGEICNNYVKTVTFKGNITFSHYEYWGFSYGTDTSGKRTEDGNTLPGYLESSSLEKIIFEGSASFENLRCPNLTDIYFKSSVPTLSGSWSNYSTAPASQITAHVAAWTQEECDNKKQSAAVWNEFKYVEHYTEGESGTVNVYVTVEAPAPLSSLVKSDYIAVIAGYDDDMVHANETASFTLNKHSAFSIEENTSEDETWRIYWHLKTIYVNGKDVSDEIVEDMTTYYSMEDLSQDTYIRVVFEPNCYFVRVMSLGPDLLWTDSSGENHLIDCAEGDIYYVVVPKNGDGVIVRSDMPESVYGGKPIVPIYWKNNGIYDVGDATMDEGGIERCQDGITTSLSFSQTESRKTAFSVLGQWQMIQGVDLVL